MIINAMVQDGFSDTEKFNNNNEVRVVIVPSDKQTTISDKHTCCTRTVNLT